MKSLDHHRNIGISAHIDSGKTTLTERILYYCGRIHRMQEVKGGDGGATMDYMDLERERGITITSASTQVEWEDHSINVIDTPGHVDFTVEVERSLRVLDGAVLVLCAVGGVQSQSLTVDRQMKRYGVPRIAFINKVDRIGANPASVIDQIQKKLGVTPLALQIPMGLSSEFAGVIDLVEMQAVYFDGEQGEDIRREAIPAEYAEEAAKARAHMLETLSLYSDDLMVALLEERPVTTAEIRPIIREATLSQELTPVMMGTAFRNKGVQELLDAVIAYLPNPQDRKIEAIDLTAKPEAGEAAVSTAHGAKSVKKPLTSSPDDPLVAMAFKTVVETFGQLTYFRVYQGKIQKGESYTNQRTGKKMRFGRLVRMHADQREDVDVAEAGDIVAVVGVDCASGDTFCGPGVDVALESIFVPEPVIRLSIEPLKRDGADRLSKALERFRREDPTFRVMTDQESGQTLIAGMGQLHLEVYVERIRREYKCETLIGEPKVAYRECPTKATEFNFKHKKQTGGSGQYAHVVGKIEPLPEDFPEPYEFVNEVTQGRVPKEYIKPVDEGFKRALDKGPLCECPVVGVRAILQDGTYHDVDSSEMAFNICGFNCMRDTLKKAKLALQEPIMKLEVEVPEEFQGPVTGHISSKRGIITQTEVRNAVSVILAEVPLATMFDYANELRSMTQGKGSFSMEFFRYKQVPNSLQDDVIARRRAEKEERLAMANQLAASGVRARLLSVGTILAQVWVGGCAQTAPAPNPRGDSVVVSPAASAPTKPPDVEILSWDQTQKRREEFRGKVVVLDVWSTYCDPCVREFPNLVALQKRFGDKVRCISFDTDYSGAVREPPESFRKPVLDFLSKHGANDLLNVISRGPSEDFFNKIHLGGPPAVFVYDQSGKLVHRFDNSQTPKTPELTYARDVVPLVEKLLTSKP